MSSPHLILYKTCPTSSMYDDNDLFLKEFLLVQIGIIKSIFFGTNFLIIML